MNLHSIAPVSCSFALLLLAACAPHDSGGHTVLPRPPSDARASLYEPARPFTPVGGGAAGRDVFRTDSGRGYTIEVRDYLTPLDKAVSIGFGGAAVVEVRDGGGEASIGGATLKIAQGSILAVPDDASLQVTARGEPITLRAWIYH